MANKIAVGQTATHPTTGARVRWDGKGWQPAGQAPSPMRGGVNSDWLGRRTRGEPVLHPNDDPFRFIQDPKRRDITRGSEFNKGSQALTKRQESVDMARNGLGMLDEFDQLNDQIRPSGGVVNRASNWVSDTLGDEKLSRMTQITNAMARLQRQPGEGAVSDFEGRVFLKMVGGYDKPYATNRAYSAAARAVSKRMIEQHQFKEAFLRTNGTLVGWDSMWGAYRDRNPVLGRDGKPRKVPTWQQFFANEARAIAGTPQPGKPADDGWSVSRVK